MVYLIYFIFDAMDIMVMYEQTNLLYSYHEMRYLLNGVQLLSRMEFGLCFYLRLLL